MLTRSIFAAVAALSVTAGSALADDAPRFGLLEENDSLYTSYDRHYTQGIRLSYLSPDLAAHGGLNAPFDLAGGLLPIFSDAGSAARPRRIAVFLGQSIFTPQNTALAAADSRDRPYAGWAYLGASLLQESNRGMLENLEFGVGLVGPGALGKMAQNDYHQFIGADTAKGWSGQLRNEPGVMLTYERLWRLPLVNVAGLGVDIVPQLGATIGNVFTYGAGGGLIRFGRNLQADYGPARIRPALSGSDYFDSAHLDGDLGFYAFVGVQGRVVGQNIFLDGNTFRDSPNVERRIFVGDLQAGVSVFWSNAVQMIFSAAHRTREFDGQRSPDVIGTASIAFSL